MQEGTLFFLICWLTVWYIVFLENVPAQKQSRHLAVIFTILICGGIYMNILEIQVNIIWLPIIFWSFYQWRSIQNGNLMLAAISVFGVMVAFACFRILTMLYPVWLITDWKILCSLLVIVVSAIFQRGWNLRLSTLFLGSLAGQIIFALLLSHNGMPIGKVFSLETLDFLSLMILINGIWHGVEKRLANRSARKSFMTLPSRNREMR